MTDSTTSPATTAEEELPHAERRQWLSLITVCVGTLMIILDGTIVNVALPKIQEDLGFSQSALTWIVNAYLISFGSLLLVAGRMGDLFGRKRMFLWGLLLFVLASVLCGLANSQGMLIAGRFLQGIGGALASASVLAIIYTDFRRPDEQARAMGVYTFVALAGGSIGLLLGGIIVDTVSWHWIFFINVPIGIATYIAAVKLVHESEKHEQDGGVDYFGSALVTVSVAIGVFAIVGGTEHGWTSLRTLGLGALAVFLLVGFLSYENSIKNPIMPLRVLRIRSLMYSNWIRSFIVIAMFASFFMGALFMEQALGYSPIEIGFAFLPLTVIMAVLSLRVTPWVVQRFGVIKPVLAALPFGVIAMLLLSRADSDTSYFPLLLAAFLLLGTSTGLAFTPLIMLSMRDVAEADAGLASGIINVSQQLAGAFGLAVLSSIATSRTDTLVADGIGEVDALVEGYQLAYLIGALSILAAIAVTLLARREPATTKETARADPATEST